ncbi:hypothetical protein FRACYDRAFT_193812 [Fragilariopsis cylindrus CCMP1102]|uniref:Methyltransferase domain-containing protein n=1 Tax=Fragilariopsis cylindrus CCMP1102 TaxID=635003 RepID=A0A1E7EXC7_9STRA|nr:hypothetical protein FRACYDRAFT_193812 [Fragilariopsis cylindrus CCMP1102]|eukprot:OEU10465.1 hypothetical protein FRACYDRAFT_193812 [Fragilariopsis cylindrus CCMP1102]
MLATSTSASTSTSPKRDYVPSKIEKYIIDNRKELGYDPKDKKSNPTGCNIWDNSTIPPINNDNNGDGDDSSTKNMFHDYSFHLDRHIKAVKDFQPIPNLLKSIIDNNNNNNNSSSSSSIEEICSAARPHPDGLSALFSNSSNQLSYTERSGFIEPLYPPMRNHKICYQKPRNLMSLDYLIHDFESMCLQLKSHSKIVLIDMGASLSFHKATQEPPIVTLLELYEKFGFHFDHIYGFETTFTDPSTVYKKLLPEKYMHNYHWINVGVNHTEEDKLNPLHSILKKFTEDDFIVVKLDIDTSFIEKPLAYQILNNTGAGEYDYHRLIDQFYFEDHVHLKELAGSWGRSMDGTISDTLELFSGLRSKGIPAHFWP